MVLFGPIFRLLRFIFFVSLILTPNLSAKDAIIPDTPIFFLSGFEEGFWNEPHYKDKLTKLSLSTPSFASSLLVAFIDPEATPYLFSLNQPKLPDKHYSFVIPYSIPDLDREIYYLWIPHIGERWELWTNSHLVHDEMHDSSGQILSHSRETQGQLIPIPKRFLQQGNNDFIFHVHGNPLIYATGFFNDYLPKLYLDFPTQSFFDSWIHTALALPLIIASGLFLFLRKGNKERYYTYFFGMSFFYAMMMITRTNILEPFFDDHRIIIRSQYVCFYFSICLFYLFIHSILHRNLILFDKLIIGAFGVVGILESFIRMERASQLMILFQILAIAYSIYLILFIMIPEVKKDIKLYGKIAIIKGVYTRLTLGYSLFFLIAILEIITTIFYKERIYLSTYGALLLITGISSAMYSKISRITSINQNLSGSLNESKNELRHYYSLAETEEKKKSLLEEWIGDIVFTLNQDFYFKNINSIGMAHFAMGSNEIESKKFLDICSYRDEDSEKVKHYVESRLSELIAKRVKVTQFPISLRSNILGEPKEYIITIELMETITGVELFGHAKPAASESIHKTILMGKLEYRFGNYIYQAEEASAKLVQELKPFFSEDKVEMYRFAILEMIINSIEHGNLEIGYKEKTEALQNDRILELWEAKQILPENKKKSVRIHCEFDQTHCSFLIEDDGKGFDYSPFTVTNIEDIPESDEHGRGITLARSIFDKVEYRGAGNQVYLEIKFENQENSPSPTAL